MEVFVYLPDGSRIDGIASQGLRVHPEHALRIAEMARASRRPIEVLVRAKGAAASDAYLVRNVQSGLSGGMATIDVQRRASPPPR